MPGSQPRDVVVVGASAGGVEALRTLAGSLPADLPAALLVVMHMRESGPSALPMILDRAGPLRAIEAKHGMPLRHGMICVAPPGRHLLLDDGAAVLTSGPTESGHRPAINALFRSAAVVAGPRAVGIVLSGVLDDGANGLRAIADRGGVTMVQDPADALYAGMPENALRRVKASHVLAAGTMGAVLARVVRVRVDPADFPLPAAELLLEDKITRDGMALAEQAPEGGEQVSGYSCPDCNGTLVEFEPGSGAYRCRIGHAWSNGALELAAQGDQFQRALWTALRSLDEKMALARKMELDAGTRSHPMLMERYSDTVRECAAAADVLRQFLISLDTPHTEPVGD